MALDPAAVDRILRRFMPLGDVRARAMFGGAGIYRDALMFGLISSKGALYLRSDDGNRATMETAGAAPFRPFTDRPMRMPYHSVPAAVFDDADMLIAWAEAACAAAARAAAAKKPRNKRRRSGD